MFTRTVIVSYRVRGRNGEEFLTVLMDCGHIEVTKFPWARVLRAHCHRCEEEGKKN